MFVNKQGNKIDDNDMDENNNQSENDIRSDIRGWSDILSIDNTH